MYKVEIIETNDGHRFETIKEANEYLDGEYGKIICNLSIKLCDIVKYKNAISFIEDNLNQFAKLIELKKELSDGIKEE